MAASNAFKVVRQLASQSEKEGASSPLPSFAEVYASNVRYVWQSLRRLGVGPGDLDDVCQEVFVIVHRKLPSFDGRSQVRTWIYGIALRCASAYRRNRARREVPTRQIDQQQVDGGQL